MPKNASSSKKFGKQLCIWFVFKPVGAVKSSTFEISRFQMKRDLSIKTNVFFFHAMCSNECILGQSLYLPLTFSLCASAADAALRVSLQIPAVSVHLRGNQN